MPPVEGPERARFREQAQRDFSDFAMIGDAEAELTDGILTLRIDLRPRPARNDETDDEGGRKDGSDASKSGEAS
jgi:hypothetical protein